MSKGIETTNIGLNVGVHNREVSSWYGCHLREIPLYFENTRMLSHSSLCDYDYGPVSPHVTIYFQLHPRSTSILKISGVVSQFAMQNSGIVTPEVEVHSSFAIPKSVKYNGI
jgi:hypothetical protein